MLKAVGEGSFPYRFQNKWATASTVTNTVAAATTTPRICTMLSLLIVSLISVHT